jgi:hypothetical protein
MVQGGENLGLALEAGQSVQIRHERVRQDLERDVAPELRVACPVDHAHTAAAERRADFEGPEASSRWQRHEAAGDGCAALILVGAARQSWGCPGICVITNGL